MRMNLVAAIVSGVLGFIIPLDYWACVNFFACGFNLALYLRSLEREQLA